MIELLGQTQQQLLRLLNKHKNGLTIAELTTLLGVSRNAVNQHIVSLEKNGLIAPGAHLKTAGRPTQSFVLTTKGRELLPRKYSWFAQILLETISSEKNEKGFVKFLDKTGSAIAARYLPVLKKLTPTDRLREVASILNGLGYEAEVIPTKDKSEISKLEVSNCIFLTLANTCPQICKFDLGLLSTLTGQKVDQQSCIAQGANACCFGVKK